MADFTRFLAVPPAGRGVRPLFRNHNHRFWREAGFGFVAAVHHHFFHFMEIAAVAGGHRADEGEAVGERADEMRAAPAGELRDIGVALVGHDGAAG